MIMSAENFEFAVSSQSSTEGATIFPIPFSRATNKYPMVEGIPLYSSTSDLLLLRMLSSKANKQVHNKKMTRKGTTLKIDLEISSVKSP